MLTVREGFYDEMLDEGGETRPHARTLVEALAALGPEALAAAGRRRDAIFMQQGITFDAAGPEEFDPAHPVRDRPFPLDLVPRIIPAADKAIYHYVPAMIRYYLGEEPILDNVPTYLMTDAEQRAWVIERLGEMVAKPTSESGGRGVFIGPTASDEEVARQAEDLTRRPERWIAQELVRLSTVPTAAPDGSLAPRHVDLRPFAVFGDDIRIVPGGLTRVALREGSMIVNSSPGGGSKDTWVLDEGTDPSDTPAARWAPPRMPGLSQGEWSSQQQQQQQAC